MLIIYYVLISLTIMHSYLTHHNALANMVLSYSTPNAYELHFKEYIPFVIVGHSFLYLRFHDAYLIRFSKKKLLQKITLHECLHVLCFLSMFYITTNLCVMIRYGRLVIWPSLMEGCYLIPVYLLFMMLLDIIMLITHQHLLSVAITCVLSMLLTFPMMSFMGIMIFESKTIPYLLLMQKDCLFIALLIFLSIIRQKCLQGRDVI